MTAKKSDEAGEGFGQLLRDIKDFQLKGRFETRWDFSKEITEAIPGKTQINDADDLAVVLAEIMEDKTIRANVGKTLKITDPNFLDQFIADLTLNLPSLFKIESYDNVVSVISNTN